MPCQEQAPLCLAQPQCPVPPLKSHCPTAFEVHHGRGVCWGQPQQSPPPKVQWRGCVHQGQPQHQWVHPLTTYAYLTQEAGFRPSIPSTMKIRQIANSTFQLPHHCLFKKKIKIGVVPRIIFKINKMLFRLVIFQPAPSSLCPKLLTAWLSSP